MKGIKIGKQEFDIYFFDFECKHLHSRYNLHKYLPKLHLHSMYNKLEIIITTNLSLSSTPSLYNSLFNQFFVPLSIICSSYMCSKLRPYMMALS